MPTTPEPTDDDLVRLLRGAPADAWDALEVAVAALAADAEPYRWVEPEPRRVRSLDGTEHEVFVPGWVEYGAAVAAVSTALGHVGAITVFDWPSWSRMHGDVLALAPEDLSVAEAVRVLTTIVRSDRFAEGALARQLDTGRFLGAAQLLCTWRGRGMP